MDGLILGTDFKMTNIAKLTEARIKKLTMDDLKDIFAGIEENEANLIVKSIRENRFDRVASILEFVTYQIMQKKVTK